MECPSWFDLPVFAGNSAAAAARSRPAIPLSLAWARLLHGSAGGGPPREAKKHFRPTRRFC
jgi:hypothetical protein